MRTILIARGGLLALLVTAALTPGAQLLHAQQTDGHSDVLRQAQERAKQIERQTGMKIPEFTPEEKKAMIKEYALGLVQAGQLCSAFKHDPSLIDSSKKMALDILVGGVGMPKAEAEAAVAVVPPQDTKPDNMLAVKIQCSMINAPIE
ncbi:hypothetical protein [Bradyrhizobium sp. CER78]|uniref:hypothetical protein n=1 Tax=Bradyrhizobium sp. CER78 TaxID=3039162 RepID=UPI00244C8D99|nr:hypothetical protein [Bradyrhizobium sp. CER78]MDH2381830.1 hypothetical protein [Bradyrhizobium sp. CER78]